MADRENLREAGPRKWHLKVSGPMQALRDLVTRAKPVEPLLALCDLRAPDAAAAHRSAAGALLQVL